MYVVKVGEYYVRHFNSTKYRTNIDNEEKDHIVIIGDITLSKETMRGLNKSEAVFIAKKLNGEVIEIAEEVTNE